MKFVSRIIIITLCLSIISPTYNTAALGQEKSLGQKVNEVFKGGLDAVKEFWSSSTDKNPSPKYIVEMHDGRILRANEYWNEGEEVVLKAYDAEVHVKKSNIKDIRER